MEKAGDILKNLSIFNSYDENKAVTYSSMFSCWEKTAGKKLAEYSRIVDLNRKTLVVEVDHPAIIQLLQIRYREILQKIRKKYPELEIDDIRMFVKNSHFKEGKARLRKSVEFTGDDAENSVTAKNEVNLDKIEDSEFRDLLLNMKKRSQV